MVPAATMQHAAEHPHAADGVAPHLRDATSMIRPFPGRARLSVPALLLATVAWTSPTSAQDTGTIAGTVRAARTGAPLAGVELRIAGTGRRTATDARGRYRLVEVPAGPVTIVVRLLGWSPASALVNVTAGDTVTADFALADAPVALDQVVVTYARDEQRLESVPAAITTRDVEQLRRDGFTYGTDEFRGVPGVSFRRGEGDGDEFPFVSIRGSNGTEGYLALLDGIPLVGIYEEPLLNQVPYDALERVEVVKGPISALYGRGALYGAVNYITREPRANATSITGSVGSHGYYRTQGTVERLVGREGALLLQGSWEDYGGWRTNGGRRLGNAFGRLRLPLGDRTVATVYGNYADLASELPNGVPLTAEGGVISMPGGRRAFHGWERPSNDQQVAMGAVRVEHRLSPALALAVTAHARRIDRDVLLNFFDPFGFDPDRSIYAINGYRGTSRQTVLFGDATVAWSPGRHDILVGFMGERSTVHESARWSGQYGFTPDCGFAFFLIEIDYTTGAIVNGAHPCFERDVPQTRDRFVNPVWGVFAQDEIALGESLYLTLGARYDAFRRTATFEPIAGVTEGGVSRADADAVSSRAALAWRTDRGQLYASYGRGFNSNFGPTFEWDATQYARPESRPTTIDSYELGWKGRLAGDWLRGEAAAFHTRQRNRRTIVPNPDAAGDPTAPSNLVTYGQLYDSRGVEVALHARPRTGTAVTASWGLVEPVWRDFVVTTFGGQQLDFSGKTPTGIARQTAYLAADQRLAGWLEGRATVELYDDYQITQDNAVSGGGYELLTVGARVRPPQWPGVTLDVTVTNALDRTYWSYFGGRTAPTYATPGVPRQLRTTLRATF